MKNLLKDFSRFLLKFCWIIVACALLGLASGFLTKKDATKEEKYSYITSAKLTVDIERLEESVDPTSENAGELKFSLFNTAYSLLPTFREIIYSKNTVLQRISEEYFAISGEEITPDELIEDLGVSYHEGALTFDVSYKSEDKEKCETIVDLVCKYGLEVVNNVSVDVKLCVGNVSECVSSAKLLGTSQAIDAFITKINNNTQAIYDNVKATLTGSDYVSIFDIQNSFKFTKDNGSLKIEYLSSNENVANKVVQYVLSSSFLGTELTIDEGITNSKNYVDEISTTEIIDVNESRAVNNIVSLTVAGAVCSFVVLCIAFLYINRSKVFCKTEQKDKQ